MTLWSKIDGGTIRAGARLVALLASGTGVSSAREVEPVARIDNA